MTEPLTITDAARALRQGELTSVELVRRANEQADRLDGILGTFLCRTRDEARAAAERADAELAAGHDRGPLHGIPVGIKDILATSDAPTTAQSLVLDPTWGAKGDAAVVSRLREAGAVVMGKTSTMEFAIGLPDPSKPFPVPRNPWVTTAWSGGSSSGTANGVASGQFLGGVGTDTGGSIRMPSALCGITGLKPTFGRVPTTGVFPLAVTLDHVGPMARSARDCALLLQAMAGHDATDPFSADVAVPDYTTSLHGELTGLRVGVERTHHTLAPSVDPAVARRFEDAIEVLAGAGVEVVEVGIADYDALQQACVITTFAEAFSVHRVNLQQRWADYGRPTRIMVATGALYSATDYVHAQRIRRKVRRDVLQLLTTVDVLATLTVGTGAPAVDGLDFASVLTMPVFTPVWNGLGLPALSVPIGFNDAGLPAGMQLVAGPFDEAMVLRVGDGYQRRTNWHLQTPDPVGQ